MATLYLSLQILCLVVFGSSDPIPGRVPKVYNALITSNQNLEPSKAYPVYQPVIQESAFGFPYQPSYYYGGEFPGLYPIPPGVIRTSPPKLPEQPKEKTDDPAEPDSSTPKVSIDTPEGNAQPSDDNNGPPAPPLPPSTQSPIPLNQFGLPPAVLPLGRFDPSYDGFSQISPFYNYPGFRFYDPYDPYGLSPYPNLNLSPFFRGIPNIPALGSGPIPQEPSASSPATPAGPSSESPAAPPEPNDLNVLNYSSKDPAIPNVPPPPIPQGGLKSDPSE